MMRRREFIVALGGMAAASPIAAHGEQGVLPTVGFLNAQSEQSLTHVAAAFRQGLYAVGYVEGQNVAIVYRWADGQADRLPALANDLIQKRVSVIAATGGDPAALAARQATKTLPIVFTIGGDPVGLGLVSSLNRPGGNVTGITQITVMLDPKRLESLHELLPQLAVVHVMHNPKNANAKLQVGLLQAAARTMGLDLRFVPASSEADINDAFARFREQTISALMVASDPFFNGRRQQILDLATRLAVPAIFHQREFVLAGGLMSYGTSAADMYHHAGIYAGRILKGEKPGELPVQQSTRTELVINLKTAKALGVEVPSTLLARADEVIE